MTSAGGAFDLLVLGCGNPSRGDDALGPELMGRAEKLRQDEALEVELIQDFQLQVEHALDLQGRAMCLFVDASLDAVAPFEFRTVEPEADRSHTTHALSPAAVLDVFQRVEARAPPSAFVLAVRGEEFELGEGLSPAARDNLEKAWAFLQGLLLRPELSHWREASLRSSSKVARN